MMVKIKEGKAIHSSLRSIPGLAKEEKQQITEVDALRLKAFEAIIMLLTCNSDLGSSSDIFV
jgi:hypothetical protein